MKNTVETKTAILPSAGYNFRKTTRHTFAYSELVTLPGPGKKDYVTGMGHFFRCSETGELRRWGFDATYLKDNGAN